MEAIAVLLRERAETLSLVERLPAAKLTQRGLGGGDWSVVELLGHLESWEEHVLGALDAWSRQQTAPVHAALNSVGLDAINAHDLARKALRSYDEQLASTLRTREQLLEAFEALSDSAWASPPLPETERTLGDLAGSLLDGAAGPFTHDSSHLLDLRALLD
jgi:hypothetical protein